MRPPLDLLAQATPVTPEQWAWPYTSFAPLVRWLRANQLTITSGRLWWMHDGSLSDQFPSNLVGNTALVWEAEQLLGMEWTAYIEYGIDQLYAVAQRFGDTLERLPDGAQLLFAPVWQDEVVHRMQPRHAGFFEHKRHWVWQAPTRDFRFQIYATVWHPTACVNYPDPRLLAAAENLLPALPALRQRLFAYLAAQYPGKKLMAADRWDLDWIELHDPEQPHLFTAFITHHDPELVYTLWEIDCAHGQSVAWRSRGW